MLIVSQDKNVVVNLDRITEIVVEDNDVIITDDIYMDYGETIGRYETEERAKKVLQEIVSKYRHFNTDGNNSVTLIPKVYEMPQK